ncbi:TetR/AcrR family transcriptional regulator [Sphingomonas flavalba]|uniref:TetR/AcrR family transcriptional regulator n=1 Tax=Sphingomonas flavalba TaxID=2559804 RepID=UPI00109DBD14|nr:TetR/AcrR family transcriptional regulator [Sphingomonas flavalba]
MDTPFTASQSPAARKPRTERGRQTRRRLIDAAAAEFGEKGFHDASISGITKRAGTALGSFYTYFTSKDEIFSALVHDLSDRVRERAADVVAPECNAVDTEREALAAFLAFARDHKEIYRIIDEAEFVDPQSYRTHYESAAARILQRLRSGAEKGEIRPDIDEAHAWAIMGMNVFLGLRYSIWSDERAVEDIARIANAVLRDGLTRRD